MAPDLFDAHIESFVWTRVLGYDLGGRHGRGLLGGRLYSQLDLPRMREAGMTGGVFSIATNPFRTSPARRRATLLANIERLQATLSADPGVAVVSDMAGYRRARADGRMGCFLAVQGGNAVGADDVASLPDVVSRVTLVHLTRSSLGSPARPLGGRHRGLTAAGRDYVAALDARRIVVDLAHVNGPGFWDALAAHDPSTPAIVSHTGVRGVHDSWRNIDDDQVRAIAATGGGVGVMFHSGFLGEGSAAAVVRHLEHVVDVGGEDCAALGSDWDGLIVPPRDMRTVRELPVLLAAMRARGFSDDRMAKVTGANYLRVVESVRG